LIKSSQAASRVNWSKVIDVSRTISVPIATSDPKIFYKFQQP
jgi:hypothetical protein